MEIKNKQFARRAQKIHTQQAPKIKKMLAAAFASLLLVAGLSFQSGAATARHQEFQHELNFYVALHSENYLDKYHHFQLALVPDIKKELRELNIENLMTAINTNQSGNNSNVVEVLLVKLLRHRQAAVDPQKSSAERRGEYKKARRAEYNLTRLGLYPAAGLDQQPAQTLDEFYMSFINYSMQTGRHQAALETIFTIMEKEQQLLAAPRAALREKINYYFKKIA